MFEYNVIYGLEGLAEKGNKVAREGLERLLESYRAEDTAEAQE
jgi:hypothetical protein